MNLKLLLQSKDIRRLNKVFNILYDDVSSFLIFQNEKDRTEGELSKSLVYGEIPFLSIKSIIEFAQEKTGLDCQNSVFYDLGSGIGRNVIACSILFNFAQSIGIEIMQDLHSIANEKKELLQEAYQDKFIEGINFIQDNIMNQDISNGDLFLLCYPFTNNEKLFLELEDKMINSLKDGAIVISLIRALRNDKFHRFGRKSFIFSWGKSTAYFYIYKKK